MFGRNRSPRPNTRALLETAEEDNSEAALVPAPRFVKFEQQQRGGIPIGKMLETARRRVDMTEAGAADRLRMTEHELLDFESGMRTPPDSVLEHMCEIYGTTVERLRSDVGIAIDDPDKPNTVWLGWASVDLTGLSNLERLMRMASTFRDLRSLSREAEVTIRDEEVMVIARTVDTLDPGLINDLRTAFNMPEERATQLFSQMRYHIVPVKELPAG